MSPEQLQRIEERRRAEAGRSQALSVGGGGIEGGAEASRDEVERKLQDMKRQTCVTSILFIVFGINIVASLEAFEELWALLPALKIYVIGEMAFYLVELAYMQVQLRTLTVENFRTERQKGYVLFLGSLAFSIWGAFQVYGESLEELAEARPQIDEVRGLLLWMVWVRLYILVVIVVMLVFVMLFMCCALCCGTRERLQQQSQRLSRLPLVKDFIKQKARTFNPEGQDN
jgi:hypothetical protein